LGFWSKNVTNILNKNILLLKKQKNKTLYIIFHSLRCPDKIESIMHFFAFFLKKTKKTYMKLLEVKSTLTLHHGIYLRCINIDTKWYEDLDNIAEE
jgi:hypothetical protein